MRAVIGAIVVSVSMAAAGLVAIVAQSAETYTATATAKTGATKATRQVSITVTRFASDQERSAVLKAAKEGSAAARKILAGLPDAGMIQVGERKAPIKYAYKRSKGPGAGDLLTIATSDPLGFLGSDQPGAASTAGFDVAVAIIDLKSDGTGSGELAPAARVSMDQNGTFTMQDYAAGTVVWLQDVKRAKH